MNTAIITGKQNQKKLSIVSFSLFFAWILSFPFEGQVIYVLAENAGINPTKLVLIAVFFHFVGLFVGGFFIKKQAAAKVAMIGSTVVCMAGSLIFFLPFSNLWYFSIAAITLFAGFFVASWGFYFKNYSEKQHRLKTAADVLIISNIIMIVINVLTVTTSVIIGLSIAICLLIGVLLLIFRLDSNPDKNINRNVYLGELSWKGDSFLKPFVFLCVFVVVITVDSGLMYQVFNPAFAHLELLISYYWAIPYIITLLILRNLSPKISQAYILYIAMIMIGLSYVLFMWLDNSVISYIIVDTLMLGAFGVCDLFWWSVFASFFDYSENPAKILGIGLSMNVLGVFIGDLIGSRIYSEGDYLIVAVIALIIIFAVMILLPILNAQLTRLLKSHTFLVKFAHLEDSEQNLELLNFKNEKELTEKEAEVVKYVLRGYTYKAIAESLFVSENTLKYHMKNIYQKLNINNKMDLIKMFTDHK